ncbi:thiamine phosphate synthase [bacterium]|nr:thiamine phosphate synthase [bacterium]
MDKRELLEKLNLYVILDCSLINYQDIERVTREIVDAGATFIQLRHKTIFTREYFNIASRVRRLCSSERVIFIVNDDVAVALSVDADGVHLGQEDLPLPEARKILGDSKIIGVSVHSHGEAFMAASYGADYLGAGSVFPTRTKEDAQVRGIHFVKDIQNRVDVPVFPIGGVNLSNINQLLDMGIHRAAVSSAIVCSQNPGIAVTKFRKILKKC